MKKLLLIFGILSLSSSILTAQDIDDFQWFGDDYEDQLFLSLGANNIHISNNDAPNSNNHKQSGTTIKLDLKQTNFEKGGASMYFENKLMGDLILYADRYLKGKDSFYQEEESGLSSGLIGWWSFLWNITEPNRYQLAVGVNLKDFFLTAAYPKDLSKPYSNPSNTAVQEPNGNYYAAGPSIAARFIVNQLLLLEYKGELSIPFGRIESNKLEDYDGNYKNPYFMNHSLEATSSKGFFLGYELSSIFNRGDLPNNTKRSDLYIGFRIRL